MKKEYINLKDNIIDFIKKVVELNEDYVINWDIIHRFNKKYKLEDYIELILVNFPDWLHYSELNRMLKKEYNLDYTDTQILNWLWHYGFKNIWLWTYTLNSNDNYSWWKTWDIIYLYLKDEWEPKTLNDITKHVLSRKKINEWTVIAAISWYKNENRFVFYTDWKIWLKEWGLINERKKKEVPEYEISISKAFDILKEKKLIPSTFLSKELIEIFYSNFWDKISQNTWSIYTLLKNKEKIWEIIVRSDWRNNIYSLIK